MAHFHELVSVAHSIYRAIPAGFIFIEKYASVSPFGGYGFVSGFQITYPAWILMNRTFNIWTIKDFQAMNCVCFEAVGKVVEMRSYKYFFHPVQKVFYASDI